MKTAIKDPYTALKSLIVDTMLIDAEDIKPSSRLVEDLGADPVEIEELLAAIEQKWGIEIPEEVAARIESVQDIADHIEEQSES